jgi:hypothetical protein
VQNAVRLSIISPDALCRMYDFLPAFLAHSTAIHEAQAKNQRSLHPETMINVS